MKKFNSENLFLFNLFFQKLHTETKPTKKYKNRVMLSVLRKIFRSPKNYFSEIYYCFLHVSRTVIGIRQPSGERHCTVHGTVCCRQFPSLVIDIDYFPSIPSFFPQTQISWSSVPRFCIFFQNYDAFRHCQTQHFDKNCDFGIPIFFETTKTFKNIISYTSSNLSTNGWHREGLSPACW